jgi:hypothetical protein
MINVMRSHFGVAEVQTIGEVRMAYQQQSAVSSLIKPLQVIGASKHCPNEVIPMLAARLKSFLRPIAF